MDRGNLKRIFEKEIQRHYDQEQSYKLQNKGSKPHKDKIKKHMHKRHQTIELARKLGLECCKCCGGLRLR